jgi:hypothetical protein
MRQLVGYIAALFSGWLVATSTIVTALTLLAWLSLNSIWATASTALRPVGQLERNRDG